MRTSDGDVMAFVNGDPLAKVGVHYPDGFAFGRGPGADELALSILADYFGEMPTLDDIYQGASLGMQFHHDFKWAVITPASKQGKLTITSAEIEIWLSQHM